MSAFQFACNRTSWPCGCATWYERDPATYRWVRKHWNCLKHCEAT